MYDVIIIGGGPGGYVAAIRARQLGLSAALVESGQLGGVCLNWGCIPTKSLLRNAEVVSLLKQGETFGFSFDKSSLNIDYSAAFKRSREVSKKLVAGVSYLMKKNGVEVFNGRGVLKSAGKVEVNGAVIEGKNIVLATGAHAGLPPGITAGKRIITARQALELQTLPKSIVIAGAGAIGMEFAQVFSSYGAEVTVIEMAGHVLPLEDGEIGREVEKAFKKRGVEILTNAKVESAVEVNDRVEIIAGGKKLSADLLLVSAGVRPNTDGLGLEALGVKLERAFVAVDDQMRTSVKNIYAIGDVTGKLALAHVASAQGIVAVETIAAKNTEKLNYSNMPRCTYCSPEVASCGLTEKAALQNGYKVKVGKFPFSANGKALGLNEPGGFIKIVTDEKYGEILGVHMVGAHVTELVAGAVGMISLEATAQELGAIVHPHPTLSEALMEAAHAALGEAIHI